MFKNPLRKNNTYLRKKSELLRDYVTVGIFISTIGIFAHFQYMKYNPPDPVEEKQYSQEYNILDLVQDKLRKQVNVKIAPKDSTEE